VATTLTAGGLVALMWHHAGIVDGTPVNAAQTTTQTTAGTNGIAHLAALRSPSLPRSSGQRTPKSASGHVVHRVSATHRTAVRSTRTRRAPAHKPHPAGAAEPAASAQAAHWVRPGTGTISSCFCSRWGTFHWGVDLAAPYGAPIYAAGDGVVLRAGPATGFGQAVYVQHANGDTTVYGHMEKILVSPGQHVRAGQRIALVGAEGEATGPHLHFEVHQGSEYGTKIDPGPWLAARGVHL
jgi:murein DD-endopeptidase MepM/ murein hydrolase activator NlpD